MREHDIYRAIKGIQPADTLKERVRISVEERKGKRNRTGFMVMEKLIPAAVAVAICFNCVLLYNSVAQLPKSGSFFRNGAELSDSLTSSDALGKVTEENIKETVKGMYIDNALTLLITDGISYNTQYVQSEEVKLNYVVELKENDETNKKDDYTLYLSKGDSEHNESIANDYDNDYTNYDEQYRFEDYLEFIGKSINQIDFNQDNYKAVKYNGYYTPAIGNIILIVDSTTMDTEEDYTIVSSCSMMGPYVIEGITCQDGAMDSVIGIGKSSDQIRYAVEKALGFSYFESDLNYENTDTGENMKADYSTSDWQGSTAQHSTVNTEQPKIMTAVFNINDKEIKVKFTFTPQDDLFVCSDIMITFS